MKTLQYYWKDGTHTTFDGYTIDKKGIIKNKNGYVMSQHKDKSGYNNTGLRHEGTTRGIRVARALASTFLGPPPTLHHTAEHKNTNRGIDTLDNIIWEDISGQMKNRTMPADLKSACIVVRDGVEHTVKEWEQVLKDETTPFGNKYTVDTIKYYVQKKLHGFQYKSYPNLRREVWKPIPWSKNSHGEWSISNMNRMKYKTKNTENVLTVDKLYNNKDYPEVRINGKTWTCHELSMMMFRPKEYAAKLPNDIILHKNDNKFDFNPFRLRFGSHTDNIIDAYNNGKRDGAKTAPKYVESYINGVFEKKHDSIRAAVKYLKDKYPKAYTDKVSNATQTGCIEYDRVWKLA